MLKEIIREIRFLAMTPAQFSSSTVLSGILTDNECLAIYQNLINPDSWPIPLDLSSNRKQRQSSSLSSSLSKIRCLRQVENDAVVLLEPNDYIEVSFTADKDVMITGIIIANIAPLSEYVIIHFLKIIIF